MSYQQGTENVANGMTEAVRIVGINNDLAESASEIVYRRSC